MRERKTDRQNVRKRERDKKKNKGTERERERKRERVFILRNQRIKKVGRLVEPVWSIYKIYFPNLFNQYQRILLLFKTKHNTR